MNGSVHFIYGGGGVSQGCRSALRETSLLEALQGRVAEWCGRQFFRHPCRKAVPQCGSVGNNFSGSRAARPCCGVVL